MTSTECRSFMKINGILQHWILPQNNLNSGMTYANRPIGKSPEMIPMDSSLNKDLHEAVKEHRLYRGTPILAYNV